MSQVCRFAFVLVLSASISLSFGQAAPKPAASTAPAPPAFEKKQIAELLAQLTSNDDGQIPTATIEIQAVIGKNKLQGFHSLTADFLPACSKPKNMKSPTNSPNPASSQSPMTPETFPPPSMPASRPPWRVKSRKKPSTRPQPLQRLHDERHRSGIGTTRRLPRPPIPISPNSSDQLKQQIRGTPASGQATTDSIIKTLPADNEDAYLLASSSMDITSSGKGYYWVDMGGGTCAFKPSDKFIRPNFSGRFAASFSAGATLKPDGLDTAVPQLSPLYQSFGQNMHQSSLYSLTYDNPVVTWADGQPAGGVEITYPSTHTETFMLGAKSIDSGRSNGDGDYRRPMGI